MRSQETRPSQRTNSGITGMSQVQRIHCQRKGRQSGIVSITPIGAVSSAKKVKGSRLTTSNTPMGRRFSTASVRILRAMSGRKWWKALKIVRKPVRDVGTAVASTGVGTKPTRPDELADTYSNAGRFG